MNVFRGNNRDRKMLIISIFWLFGIVFGALELGTLFRHPKLAGAVTFEDTSRIDLSGRAYSAMLKLEDTKLKVLFIDGLNIILISKQGNMTTPNTNNPIKVQHGTMLVIYHGPKFQKNRYGNATPETLQKLVDSDTSALVFGVVIQNPPAPVRTPLGRNWGFMDISTNLPENAQLLETQGFLKILTNPDQELRGLISLGSGYCLADLKNNEVGVIIRGGRDHVVNTIGTTMATAQHNDIFLWLSSKKQIGRRLLDQIIFLVNQDKRHLLSQEFPNVTSLVATIVNNIPSYLEEITIIGKGSLDSASFVIESDMETVLSWKFNGNSMSFYQKDSRVMLVANDEPKDVVDNLALNVNQMRLTDLICFREGFLKFPDLRPRDIIVAIAGNEERVRNISSSAIKRAVAGCKSSAELRKAFNGLNLHSSITVMAALVSDNIPPPKMIMVGFTTNKPADAVNTKTLASWVHSESEVKVSLAEENASASIVMTGRNKVSIKQIGGAVALIIDKDGGLKYGSKVAFGNTHRPVHLEPGEGVADHDDLQVEDGDTVMVILPLCVEGIKWKPFEIAATIHDFDTMEEHLDAYLSEEKTAVICARIKRMLD